jgi:hypothetical protein
MSQFHTFGVACSTGSVTKKRAVAWFAFVEWLDSLRVLSLFNYVLETVEFYADGFACSDLSEGGLVESNQKLD